MEIDYFDKIQTKSLIKVEVKTKVYNFLEKDAKNQEEMRKKEQEMNFCSLDSLMEKGFQPTTNTSIENELNRKHKEEQYLNSPEYKAFRKALRQEIRNVIDIMSEQEKRVMYLRFFKDLSISQIAQLLNISKSSVQEYIRRGCKYIKFFLDKDIKQQDKIEKKKRMQIEQAKYKKLNSQNK